MITILAIYEDMRDGSVDAIAFDVPSDQQPRSRHDVALQIQRQHVGTPDDVEDVNVLQYAFTGFVSSAVIHDVLNVGLSR